MNTSHARPTYYAVPALAAALATVTPAYLVATASVIETRGQLFIELDTAAVERFEGATRPNGTAIDRVAATLPFGARFTSTHKSELQVFLLPAPEAGARVRWTYRFNGGESERTGVVDLVVDDGIHEHAYVIDDATGVTRYIALRHLAVIV